YGRVVDADTGMPIQNATLSVAGQTATSNLDGAYEIQNIEAEAFAVSVTAEGYQVANSQVSAQGYGRILLDMPLKKIQISDVALSQVSLNQSHYGAYNEVQLSGVVINRGDSTEEVFIHAEVLNPSGTV